MRFPSFVTLERYARIDLGVRIELPWGDIARMTHEVSHGLAPDHDPTVAVPHETGPHCAVGRIFYDTGEEGVLVYVKASLTGDEKDYVLDYKRRNPAFPHETTGDQFFSEEQFEAYRALGFHIAYGFWAGDHNLHGWTSLGCDPKSLRLLTERCQPPWRRSPRLRIRGPSRHSDAIPSARFVTWNNFPDVWHLG